MSRLLLVIWRHAVRFLAHYGRCALVLYLPHLGLPAESAPPGRGPVAGHEMTGVG